jgi:nucleolar GTP-binding protein
MKFNLPHVYTSEEVINKAFKQGSKSAKIIRSTPAPRLRRMRDSEKRRIVVASRAIEGCLRPLVKQFPSYEQLPPFYQKLLEIKVTKDRYKKSLGAVQWALNNASQVRNETVKEITRKETNPSKEYLGRVASIIKRIRKELDDLIEIKEILLNFPVVEDLPTIVIAGYPNVGKSTFTKTLTGSNVKIASYPFTTQDLLVGHKKTRYVNYQIIDSPGILERPMGERNEIEMQAVLAIKELADAVLFIIDPTQDLVKQKTLLNEVEKDFGVPVFIALNKADIAPKEKIEEAKKEFSGYEVYVITAKDAAECEKIFDKISAAIK